MPKLRAIIKHLGPVSTVVANDASALRMLMSLNGSSDGLREVRSCAHAQPLPAKVHRNNMEHRGADHGTGNGNGIEWRRSHYQVGSCSVQLALALRFRTCLGLIELAEQRRAWPYQWVVRSRPDITLPCAIGLSAFHPTVVLYVEDFLVMMPRAAATASLAQVPLARRLNATACFMDVLLRLPRSETVPTTDDGYDDANAAYWHTMERCNPCVMRLSGWPTADLSAEYWSTQRREYVGSAVATPHKPDGATLAVGDVAPFGSSTNEGAGISVLPPPNCLLAPDSGHARRERVPILKRPLADDIATGEDSVCFRGAGGGQLSGRLHSEA